jgi:hypothetical protein
MDICLVAVQVMIGAAFCAAPQWTSAAKMAAATLEPTCRFMFP